MIYTVACEYSDYDCGGVRFVEVDTGTPDEAVRVALKDGVGDVFHATVFPVAGVDCGHVVRAMIVEEAQRKEQAKVDAETAKERAEYERLRAKFGTVDR